jgi:protein ImuA
MVSQSVQARLALARSLLWEQRRAPHSFSSGFRPIDSLLECGGLAGGGVHEFLSRDSASMSFTFAALMIRASLGRGLIVWADPHRELYPPALIRFGLPLDRVLVLRSRRAQDELWAVREALACKGVAASICGVRSLSMVQARQLQLAAERGGGVGILLRSFTKATTSYAATTRWLVEAAPGDADIQRWKIQLIHGHGGRIGQGVLLEIDRATHRIEAHPLRAPEVLAGGPREAAAARALA